MMLHACNRQALLIMLQAFAMPSINRRIFSLSPFIVRGYKIASHVVHESASADVDRNINTIIPTTIMKKIDHAIMNITLRLESHGLINVSKNESVCHRAALSNKSLRSELTVHEKGLHSIFFLD